MKKGFGWFLSIMGVLNIFRVIATLSVGSTSEVVGIFIFAIIFLVLGVKLINSSKKTSATNSDTEEQNHVFEDVKSFENKNDVVIDNTNQFDTIAEHDKSYTQSNKNVKLYPKNINDTHEINIEQIVYANAFEKRMEEEFISSIRESSVDVDNMDPLIGGMVLQMVIATTSKYLKEANYHDFSKETGISKKELDTIIDRVATKVYDLIFITK